MVKCKYIEICEKYQQIIATCHVEKCSDFCDSRPDRQIDRLKYVILSLSEKNASDLSDLLDFFYIK